MKFLVGFVGVLLIAGLTGGLFYAILKKKLLLAKSLGVGVLVVSGLWLWWLSSTPAPSMPTVGIPGSEIWSQTLQSPSPKTVWEFFKDYWLWIVLVLVGPFWVLGHFANPWAKATKGIIGAIAVMLVGALIVHGVWGESSPEKVLSLTAPANGNSPTISSGENGSSVTFSGKNFIGHCIYTNGRDEAYPCSTGDGLIKLYVQDTSGKENTVTYTRS